MDKRYQVFISSTFHDLEMARQEVLEALLKADYFPAGMELFPAANEDQLTLIKRVIEESDFYIVIVAGRYGSIHQASGKSYTQLEYEYAVEIGKPVLGFVHGSPGKIAAEYCEQDAEGAAKLAKFKALVESRMVRHWTSAEKLGGEVITGLIHLRRMHAATGWVRADQMEGSAAIEILDLRKQLDIARAEVLALSVSASDDTLAHGEDEAEVIFTAAGDRSIETVKLSWNELFERLSPVFASVATDDLLREQLRTLLPSGKRSVLRIGMGRSATGSPVTSHQFEIKGQCLDMIKVQFLALGLIKQAESGLVLAPNGHAQMVSRLAIRRRAVDAESPGQLHRTGLE